MLYKLEARDVSNGVFSHVNSCFNYRKGNDIYIVLRLSIKNGYITIILSVKNRRVCSVMHQHRQQAKSNIHGCKLPLCICWDQLGVVYYEVINPKETIMGHRYKLQLIRLSRVLK